MHSSIQFPEITPAQIRMKNIRLNILFFGLLFLLIHESFSISSAIADELETHLQGLTAESRTKLKKAVTALGDLGNPAALPALEALHEKRLRVDESGRLIILHDLGDSGRDAITGELIEIQSLTLRKPRLNNTVRRALVLAIAKLKLKSDDPEVRLSAAWELVKKSSPKILDLAQSALQSENNSKVREVLSLIIAQINLNDDGKAKRLEAIKTIGKYGGIQFLSALERILSINENGEKPEPEILKAASQAQSAIEQRQFFVNQIANLFYGLSLGSILLLAALGLAISFGLMGVINMAHGEMLMLGAYSTYLIQNVFLAYFPNWFDWYLAAAIPFAFLTTALVGMILERLVIRSLYGRPLETLLATWGISLMLIQSVRLIFGAQNVAVANPAWLAGGYQLFQGVVLPYNRIAIILFAVFVVVMVAALMQKTSLGLKVRAVTQNRKMAACMGVSTQRIDLLTFGLGSGLAGLGGVALSQIGNVGPELGQLYIVDCFLVVVLGGVGKIAGTVAGAMGLGMVNKFLEPLTGAVLGKIMILVFIILFIQKRPQGIFALKGRVQDD